MLGNNFDVLTPFSRMHRVSYKYDINSATPPEFKIGEWAKLTSDGHLIKVPADADAGPFKLVLTRVSDSEYDSHDVEVGRITGIDTPGVRVRAGKEYFEGQNLPSANTELAVKADGLLGALSGATGTTEYVVATVQEVYSDYVIYEIISPRPVTTA